jgi:polysaccharide biosynthesis transport protein
LPKSETVNDETTKIIPAKSEGPQKGRGDGIQNVFALQALRKYWATASATVVLVMLGTVFYTLGQKKIYEAQATVMFDPRPPRPLGSRVESVVDMGAGSFWNNQEYYETQYQIIRSRQVALAVVRELGLQHDPSFLSNLPDGEEVRADGLKELEPERAAEVLRGRLEVVPVRDSRLATLKFRDASPRRAQRILQTLVDTYVDRNLESALQSTSSATDWLRGQLDTLKKDLEGNELALHEYKKENDILSLAFDDKVSMLSEEMGHINAELTRAKAALTGVAARRSVLSTVPTQDPTAIQSSELLQSPLLNTLRSQYELALRDRDSLLGTGKGRNHPDVAAAERRVEAARKPILKEITNIKRAVDRDVAALSRQVGGLKGMLEKARTQAHEHNKLEIEYNRLRRQKENTEKLYSLVLERTKEADLTQMLRINNISIVDSPLAPTAPVHPRVPLNLAFGLFIGIVLGVGSALGRGLLDRTLKVPDEVEDELGLPCLGLLPGMDDTSAQKATYYNKRAKRKRGRRVDQNDGRPELIVHNAPLSSVAEAARTIRTNLMFMSPDNPLKTLLVSSAGPSEGKTTVACCIATAMAQAGQRVALIDCDLRRPRVHRIFGFSSDRGVTTALLEDSVADVVRETEVPNLFVIPAGPIPPHPAELFHTEKFKGFLKDVEAEFDCVIIDSPPVAAVTDPTVLSTLVDGTVLVVRAYKTRKELARHAVRSLLSVGGNVSGVVLNDVDFSKMEYKYSYYYYRRDEYYSPDAPGSSRGAGDRDSTPPRMSASA